MENTNSLLGLTPELEAEYYAKILGSLVNTVPGGLVGINCTTGKIVFASDGVFRITGYSREELYRKYQDIWFFQVIFPQDQKFVGDAVLGQIRSRGKAELCFRMVKRDGGLIWVREYASMMEDSPWGECLLCCILDDTERMEAIGEAEEARKNAGRLMNAIPGGSAQYGVGEALMSAERYRIIMEQTQDVIFNWDMATNEVFFSSVFESKFGYPPPAETNSLIYKDDLPLVSDAVRRLRSGEPYIVVEYRFRIGDGSYIWCRNRMTAIFGADGKPAQVVGLIMDIDDDKRKVAQLKERAEKDALTGLLNRGAIQRKIEECLGRSGRNQKNAFLLIDIDNFKWINDTFGHSKGDELLAYTSALIQKQFRTCDITGRLGGDEFVVFMDNVTSVKSVVKKAQELNEVLFNTFRAEEECQPMSISIGVAMSPDHGNTFEALYDCADQALYRSKNSGRNQFTVYMVSMDSWGGEQSHAGEE